MKGIIRNPQEVAGLLDGSMTVVAVPFKSNPYYDQASMLSDIAAINEQLEWGQDFVQLHCDNHNAQLDIPSPFGKTGDKFFVKESFRYRSHPHTSGKCELLHYKQEGHHKGTRFKPATNMRQDQARIFPTVKRQWIGKVSEASEDDISKIADLESDYASLCFNIESVEGHGNNLYKGNAVLQVFKDYWYRYPKHDFETGYAWFAEVGL